jgi:gas vesicle structural protein
MQRASTVDVLERVLDKGIVIDTQIDISIAGIRLINVDARVLVSSFETYLKYADALAATSLAPRARALSPRRRIRSRRSVRAVLICPSGCAFRRSIDDWQTAEPVSCPYRAGTVCVLKPAGLVRRRG